jgi:hypothetical protein
MKHLQGLNKHRGEMYKTELLARLRSKTKKSSNKPKLAGGLGSSDGGTHAQKVAAANNQMKAPSSAAVSTKPNNVSSSVQVTKEENGATASTAVQEGETSKSCSAIKTEREVDVKVEAPSSDTGSRYTATDAMASDPPVRIETKLIVDMDSSAVISPSPDDSLDYHSMDPSTVASSETGASAEATRATTDDNVVMVVPSSSSSSSNNNDKQNSTMSKLEVESLISARVAAEAAAIMDNASSDSECHLSPPPLSAPPSPLTAA